MINIDQLTIGYLEKTGKSTKDTDSSVKETNERCSHTAGIMGLCMTSGNLDCSCENANGFLVGSHLRKRLSLCETIFSYDTAALIKLLKQFLGSAVSDSFRPCSFCQDSPTFLPLSSGKIHSGTDAAAFGPGHGRMDKRKCAMLNYDGASLQQRTSRSRQAHIPLQ